MEATKDTMVGAYDAVTGTVASAAQATMDKTKEVLGGTRDMAAGAAESTKQTAAGAVESTRQTAAAGTEKVKLVGVPFWYPFVCVCVRPPLGRSARVLGNVCLPTRLPAVYPMF